MSRLGRIAAGAALLTLAACGGGEDRSGQPTAEERDKLDNIAAKMDEQETYDTSADSLVPANGADALAAQPPVLTNGSTDGSVMGDDITRMNASGTR